MPVNDLYMGSTGLISPTCAQQKTRGKHLFVIYIFMLCTMLLCSTKMRPKIFVLITLLKISFFIYFKRFPRLGCPGSDSYRVLFKCAIVTWTAITTAEFTRIAVLTNCCPTFSHSSVGLVHPTKNACE